MDRIIKKLHDEWGVTVCPNCKVVHMLFWNSQAIWCLKCRWVKYKEIVDEENHDIPND